MQIACLIVVFLFLVPLQTPMTDPEFVDPSYEPMTPFDETTTLSEGPTIGTGEALDITLTGTATNMYDGSGTIDSSTSVSGSITLDDGWTGTNLQSTIDTLSMDVTNALRNPTLNDYHLEKWLVGLTGSYWEDVGVPDSWTLIFADPDDEEHRLNQFPWLSNDQPLPAP